jgi:cellulose synthase operon protein C
MRTALLALVFVASATSFLSADKKPVVPKGPLAEARQRLNKGNLAEARAEYTKHLSDEKLAPQAAIGIANAWRAEGELGKALDAIQEALKSNAKSADLLAARADLSYDKGQWEEATADADTALKIQDDHFLARWVQARLTRDRGDMTAAQEQMRWFVRTYNAASQADKDITNVDQLLIVGQAGAEFARWNNNSNQFRFILNEVYGDILGKFESDCWQAELYAGRMLLEKYNRPQASDAFENALKINPNAAEAFVGKGQIALQKYELKDAEQLADLALMNNPKLPEALRLKADILFMGGDFAAAEKILSTARTINPRDELTLGKLAGCFVMLKKTAAFEEITKTVEAQNKKPGHFYHELAEYLEERKLFNRAEEYFKKASELRPMVSGPRTSLGMLYMRLGKEEEAKKILDAAFKSDPFNVKVANMRKVYDHLSKYTSVQTAHYEVKFNKDTDRILAEYLADYLEETHADLKKQFNYEPEGRVPVEVFNRHDMFSGRTVGLPDLHTIGACTGKVVVMASPTAVGLRKPFNWGRVIRHEVTHIFNLIQTDFQCPHWLTEGLAVQQEKMATPIDWLVTLRDRADDNTLFNLDTILMGFARPKDPSEWGLAYCQSHQYVEYLIKTHGQASVGKMLNAYRNGLDNSAALKVACNVEKAAFEAGYREHIEQLLKPYRTGGKKAAKPDVKPLTFEELVQAVKEKPDDLELSARLADQYLKRGKTNEGRKLVDAILAKKPGQPMASLLKAKLLSRAGDEDGAKEILTTALKEAPDDPRLMNLVAKYYLDAEQYDSAAELLEKGRKLAPLDGDWSQQLTRLYTQTKNNEKLMVVLKDVVSRDPDEITGRIKLAKAAMETKQFQEAEFYARDAIMIDVMNEDAKTLLLDALTALGREAEVKKLKKRYE